MAIYLSSSIKFCLDLYSYISVQRSIIQLTVSSAIYLFSIQLSLYPAVILAIYGAFFGDLTYHSLLKPGKYCTVLLHPSLRPGQVAAADRLHFLTEAVLQELRQEPIMYRMQVAPVSMGNSLCLELLAPVKEGEKFNLGLLGGLQRMIQLDVVQLCETLMIMLSH